MLSYAVTYYSQRYENFLLSLPRKELVLRPHQALDLGLTHR